MLCHSLARLHKNHVFPAHFTLPHPFSSWGRKKMGEEWCVSLFCKLNCVHLVSCIIKYSLGQVGGKENYSVGPHILISYRPGSAAMARGAPHLSSLTSCSVWACLHSQAADLRGQPCLSLVFPTGETRTLEAEMHCNSQTLWLPLGDAQIYKAWPGNKALLDSNQTGLIPLLPVAFMTHSCLR